MEEYAAARVARELYGERYSAYIQESIADKVSHGYYSEEFAQSVGLGSLFIGNDGE